MVKFPWRKLPGLAVRVIVLLPLALVSWLGEAAGKAFDAIEPHMPRGL